MIDILNTIYEDGPLPLSVLCSLTEPQTEDERRIATQLRVVDEKVAEALIPSIERLADHQAERAFSIGTRFGAQLMAQLLEEP